MNTSDSLTMLGRATGGLVVVIVLIGLVARVVRRTRGQNGATGLRVVDRLGLSREANLTVVEVANRLLLLGVTAQGVTMLADLDDTGRSRDHDEIEDDEEFGLGPASPTILAPDVATALLRADVDAGAGAGAGDHDDHFGTTDDDERRPVPARIPLDDYPDLASALRAAGRTAPPAEPTAPRPTEPVKPAFAVALSEAPASRTESRVEPRTRAQARAEARAARAAASAQAHRPAGPRRGEPDPDAVKVTAAAGAGPKKAGRPARPNQPVQASGSVLSPQTWKQGIDALRDLTVRRG